MYRHFPNYPKGYIQNQSNFVNCQHVPVGLTERKQALVDNIDAWAMWISPPIFVLFNIVYWIYYRCTLLFSFQTKLYWLIYNGFD